MPYKFLPFLLIVLILSSCTEDKQIENENQTSKSNILHSDNSEDRLESISSAKKELFICKFDRPLENCIPQTQSLTDAILKAKISGITQERITASEKYGEILGERASKASCEKNGFKWAMTGCINEVETNIYKDPVTGIEYEDAIASDQNYESVQKISAAFDNELALGRETPTVYGPYLYLSDEMDRAMEYATHNCRLYKYMVIMEGEGSGAYVYCFPNR